MYYILYNPLANHGQGKIGAEKVKELLSGHQFTFSDIREIKDFPAMLNGLKEEDAVVIAGGDGTLNKFINLSAGVEYRNPIYYYASGSGNDFKHDVDPDGNDLILMNKYIEHLPTVTVKGVDYKFLNGIGYGIDGYCCEVGDELAKKSTKPVNYAGIAIKGLLFHYKPTNAKVTVDGKTYEYKKVWLCPTMNGRYYGGGMDIAPEQDRLAEEGSVSTVLMFGSGKLKTLMVFPSIFKGEHVKHTEMVAVHTGHDVTVEFDRPTALQIDGETVLGVTSYTVHSEKRAAVSEEPVAAEV